MSVLVRPCPLLSHKSLWDNLRETERTERMARQVNRLSALSVAKTKAPGLYPDGGGVYLNVSRAGAKSWVLRHAAPACTRDGAGKRLRS
jgi:hypothetical protein